MKKLKVMSVVGTRPEIIRLSRVLSELDNSNAIEHISVHTGQNYDFELNEIFYKDLEIRKPDYFLDAVGENAIETISLILKKIYDVIIATKPDCFLVLGDTNSCLSAIVAKRLKIPIFHMEAGNRCYDLRVPEEINRKIVDHIADINLTYSDISREYLLKEGIEGKYIIKTGSPMFEVLNFYNNKIKKSNILEELKLQKSKYFLVSIHREENVDNQIKFNSFMTVLNALAEKYSLPIIVSTHPRTRIKIDNLKKSNHKFDKKIRFMKPMSFTDYNSLQINSFMVLSDSGTISEESSILKFDALNIREAHERPEAMEEMPLIMVGLEKDRILQGVEQQSIKCKIKESRIVKDYSMPNVSKKIVKILISYTDFINQNIWKKY